MEKEYVQWKITGESITSIARDFWVEQKFSKAINFLTQGLPGIDQDLAIKICIGKKKLTGTNSVYVEEDTTVSHRNIPLIHPIEALNKIQNEYASLMTKYKDIVSSMTEKTYISSPWGLIEVPPSMTELYTLSSGIVRRGLKRGMSWDDMYFQNRKAELEQLANDNKKLQESLRPKKNNVAEVEVTKEKVMIKEDFEMDSLNGWLSPEGKYYSCKYMGHIQLAYDIMNVDEKYLEKLNWVKISNSRESMFGGLNSIDIKYIGKIPPTEAQIKKLEKWCNKHNRVLPEQIENYIKTGKWSEDD